MLNINVYLLFLGMLLVLCEDSMLEVFVNEC